MRVGSEEGVTNSGMSAGRGEERGKEVSKTGILGWMDERDKGRLVKVQGEMERLRVEEWKKRDGTRESERKKCRGDRERRG